MACGGCMQARAAFGTAYRAGSVRGMAGAVRQAIHVNVDKARQAYRQSQPVQRATPYKRPPERTT